MKLLRALASFCRVIFSGKPTFARQVSRMLDREPSCINNKADRQR